MTSILKGMVNGIEPRYAVVPDSLMVLDEILRALTSEGLLCHTTLLSGLRMIDPFWVLPE